MSKTITAFALCVMVTAQAFGGWIKTDKEVALSVGRLARVPVEIDADEVEYRILGGNVDGFREYDPDPKKLRLCVLGYENGTAYIVIAGVKGGKLLAPEIIIIKVGGGVPPKPVDPKPDPKPVDPPTPDELSEFAKSIQNAAISVNWPKSMLADVALGYEVVAKASKDATNVEKMFSTAQALLKSILGEKNPIPAAVRKVIASELTWVPTDGAHEFTAAEKERLTKTFLQIAEACKRASK